MSTSSALSSTPAHVDPPPHTRPGVAIVASCARLSARAARALNAVGVPVVACADGPAAALASHVDAAARRRDVTALLVVVDTVDAHAQLAEVLAAVARHVPVVAHVAAGCADPWIAPWFARLGCVICDSLADAGAALQVVRSADPVSGRVARVVGDGGAALDLVAAARVAGFEAASPVADVDAALSDLRANLVVVAVQSEADLAALVEARHRHRELAVVAVTDMDHDRRLRAEAVLEPLGVAVVDAFLGPRAGLLALAGWAKAAQREPATVAPLRDPGRLRRALRARTTVAWFEPELQAELTASLGLPFARTMRCPYLEDAPLVAAEVGFPVRFAVAHPASPERDTLGWEAAATSDLLLAGAGPALSAATRAHGRGAALLVASTLPRPVTATVDARRLHDYGVVVEVALGDASARWVAPVGEDEIASALAVVSPVVLEALAAATRGVVGALRSEPDVVRALVAIEVGPASFVCRHVGIHTRAGEAE